ncbi:MAG: hypothetical protein ACRD7E_15970 [Bryobacteraceae bacterium]
MKVAYLLIWGSVLVFGMTAVWALVWDIRSGEMSDFQAGAASIFDSAEPVGTPTDSFPQEHS